jgi:hypothetical protein
MRFASRIRSLQRRLKEPWSLEHADPSVLAVLDELAGDDYDPPPGPGPHPPGWRFRRFQEQVTKNLCGQKEPETDNFSLHGLLVRFAITLRWLSARRYATMSPEVR